MNDVSMVFLLIINDILLVIFLFWFFKRIAAALVPDNINQLLGLVKQNMSNLGVKSGKIRGAKAASATQKTARTKVRGALEGQIPYLKLLKGLSDNEFFSLAFDPEFVQGISRLISFGGAAIEKIMEFVGGRRKGTKQPGIVPEG